MGTENGSLSDTVFTEPLASAPVVQQGGLALAPYDSAVMIDFTGSAVAGEKSDDKTVNRGITVFNMTNVTSFTGSASLVSMSIGALSGVGPSGNAANIANAVQYSGTIIPGHLNGNANAATTYQLGGGGTLELVNVTTGYNSPGQGPSFLGNGTPLVDYPPIVSHAPPPSNVLIENGGAVWLATTNTYSGTTTIQGQMVESVPSADVNPNLTMVSSLLQQTTLIASFLGDTSSSLGLPAGGAVGNPANLVINGGVLQYVGAGAVSTRLFTIGSLGATLDSSGSGALVLSNPGAEAFTLAGPKSLTLTGSFGQVARR